MLHEILGILFVATIIGIVSVVSAKSHEVAESLWAVAAVTVVTLGAYFFGTVYDMYRLSNDQILGALLLGLIVAAMALHYTPSRTWKILTGSIACGLVVTLAFAATCAHPWR